MTHLPGIVVAAADVEHLAGSHQIVEGAQGFFVRGFVGIIVGQVDIDVVGIQVF